MAFLSIGATPGSTVAERRRWSSCGLALVAVMALLECGLLGCGEAAAQADCTVPLAILRPGDSLAIEGDSLVYGFDGTQTGGRPPINGSSFVRSQAPFPETLEALFGGGLPVVNHGYPGDRSLDGILRWSGAKTATWTILMFGTNDLGNFGHHPDGPIPVDRFAAHLRTLAERRLGDGGKVLILSAPPLMDEAADVRLEPYRRAARQVAKQLGVCQFDTPDIITAVDNKWTDGLHLSLGSNRKIAEYLRKIFAYTK